MKFYESNIQWNLDEQLEISRYSMRYITISLAVRSTVRFVSRLQILNARASFVSQRTHCIFIAFPRNIATFLTPYPLQDGYCKGVGTRLEVFIHVHIDMCIHAKLRLWSHVVITSLKKKKKKIHAKICDVRYMERGFRFIAENFSKRALQPQYRGATMQSLV